MRKIIVLLTCLLVFCVVCFFIASQISTSDKVVEWQILTENTSSHLSSHSDIYKQVHFSDTKNGILRSISKVMKTSDGGENWEEIKNWASNDIGIYSWTFDKNNYLWGVGTNVSNKPIVMKSTNEGFQWQNVGFDKKSLKLLDGKIETLFALCFDSNRKIRLVGEKGIVEAINNGSSLEVKSVFETEKALYGVSCSDSGKVWAVGENGSILHFMNGWTTKKIKENYFFKNIKLNNSEIWVFGFIISPQKSNKSGVLLRSINNGKTWKNMTPEESDVINDLTFINKDIWLVGNNGNIFNSSNNGQTWTKLKSPTKSDLHSIYSLDSNNIWISGEKETILKLIK